MIHPGNYIELFLFDFPVLFFVFQQAVSFNFNNIIINLVTPMLKIKQNYSLVFPPQSYSKTYYRRNIRIWNMIDNTIKI